MDPRLSYSSASPVLTIARVINIREIAENLSSCSLVKFKFILFGIISRFKNKPVLY